MLARTASRQPSLPAVQRASLLQLSLMGIAVAAFVTLAVYLAVKMMSNSRLSGVTLYAGPPMKLTGSAVEVSGDRIPLLSVGIEYTYGFWIHLHDITNSPQHKLVWFRSPTGTLSDASPVVYMDGTSNKLHVAVKTKAAKGGLVNLSALHEPGSGYLVSSIDYLPLARWCHVVAVVDNKTVTLFLDSEVYSVRSVDDISTKSMTPILSGTHGNVVIGARAGGALAPNAFFSGLTFYNHALRQQEVKRLYSTGPVTNASFLRKLGLPAYGLRSPVYRIADALPE